MNPALPTTVAFIGLGAMGFGMASHLVNMGYQVNGFDIHEPTRTKFREAGGKVSDSPRHAARGSEFLICMVANSYQADSILFGPETGAVEGKLPLHIFVHYTRQPWTSLEARVIWHWTNKRISPSSQGNSHNLLDGSICLCQGDTIKTQILGSR